MAIYSLEKHPILADVDIFTIKERHWRLGRWPSEQVKDLLPT